MVHRGRLVVLSALVSASLAWGGPTGSAGRAAPRKKSLKTPTQTIRLSGGYVVAIIGKPVEEADNRVEIRRHGRVVKRLGGPDWVSLGAPTFFLPALTRDEPLIRRPDQDITGDGVPDVLIREYSGGLRKMVRDYVFGLSRGGLIEYEPIGHGFADPNARYFVRGHVKALDVETVEWGLAPLFGRIADTPTPRLRLRLPARADARRWVFANQRQPMPPKRATELMAEAAALSREAGGPAGEAGYPKLVAAVAELVFVGQGDLCRRYVQAAFAGRAKERDTFLASLAGALARSDAGDRLLELNGCRTWGELLIGPGGVIELDCECPDESPQPPRARGRRASGRAAR